MSSPLPTTPDDLSTLVDTTNFYHDRCSDDADSIRGFCQGWPVRLHKHESVANRASLEARRDWLRLVGHTTEFGSANPVYGNWTSLAMPFCRPERVWITAYIIEFAFIHDTIIERTLPDGSEDHSTTTSINNSADIVDPQLGKKKLRARMTQDLLAIDPVRGRECLAEWQNMIDTTHRNKTTEFASVEEYVEFRLVDCSAPWMASLMLYGMGISLPDSAREELKTVIWPFCAAAGLENDYFSFDREYDEYLEGQQQQEGSSSDSDGDETDKESTTPIMINLISLLMAWYNIDIANAKRMTRRITMKYEQEFIRRCDEYRRKHAPAAKEIEMYLSGLQYLLSGNIVWSSNCPRYNKAFRYDPNAGVEDQLTLEKRGVSIAM